MTLRQDEVEELLFQAKAVEYRATASEEAFAALVAAKPKRAPGAERETAVLSQLLYEVAREQQFTLPSLRHLARALGEDDRLSEAAYFCDRWLALAPADTDALVLRAVLACRRHEFPAADRSFRALRDSGAARGLLWGIDTMILLAFSDGARSASTALAMLEEGCDKPWAVPLAADAALRTRDPALLLHLASVAPSSLEHSDAIRRVALDGLRSTFVDLLLIRASR